jgi:hypothetical protein
MAIPVSSAMPSETVGGKVDPQVESGLRFASAAAADEGIAVSFGATPFTGGVSAKPLIPAFQASAGESIG